jgi:cysteine synthase A
VRILDDITGAIGHTPLIRLPRLGAGLAAELVVKHEALNPGGSLKDRIALHMVDDALARGVLRAGMVIVEPTSGNTGIGLAQAAVVRGLDCVVVMPETASAERRQALGALGGRVVLTPAADGIPGSIAAAERICEQLGDRAWMPRQTDNAANPDAHYLSTGPEIWQDTDGGVDVLVAGVGTGGTITGTARYLRERNPQLHVVAVQPAGSPLLTGGGPGAAPADRPERRVPRASSGPVGVRRGRRRRRRAGVRDDPGSSPGRRRCWSARPQAESLPRRSVLLHGRRWRAS